MCCDKIHNSALLEDLLFCVLICLACAWQCSRGQDAATARIANQSLVAPKNSLDIYHLLPMPHALFSKTGGPRLSTTCFNVFQSVLMGDGYHIPSTGFPESPTHALPLGLIILM